jgi:aminomethyltransferase
MPPDDRHSQLDAAHRALKAKMVPFGGWEMPLSYPAGTLSEHRACRTAAVVFDVSHLGTVRVTGPDAFDHLNRTLTNDLAKIGPGRAQYTHLLDEADGSVLDDIIVWWVADEQFDVMPNASNTSRVVAAIGGTDVTEERTILAVQGPTARTLLREVLPDAADVARFRVKAFEYRGVACTAAGTGYTGEDGVELAIPSADAAAVLWQALLDVGIEPAGLGARDTLRLEAGLPLHGHELGPGITPLQAGLGWVVAWDKPEFVGKQALEAERSRGVSRRLRGVTVEGRQPPRQGYAVLVDGKPAGEVTSGNFSPMLGYGVALAFLPPEIEPGTAAAVEIRGKPTPGRVVNPPFVKKKG